MTNVMERVSAGLHVVLFIIETALQILTAIWNRQIGIMYCWLVAVFIVLSSLITNSVSLAWVYKSMDFAERRTGECLCISLHTFQLGLPWRCLKLWLAGDRKDIQELIVLRLLQTSIQSGPFLVLQTWLILDTNSRSKIPIAALAISLISLAYTYASNTEPLYKVLHVYPDNSSTVMQFTTRFFCHFFIMVARFLATAIFGLLMRSWLVLALVAHFVIATIIMTIHNIWKPPKSARPMNIFIWTTMQSYGCTYSLVPFSKMSFPYLFYFIIIFLENLVMSTVWFIHKSSTPENVVLYTLSLTSFLTGFVIACIYNKTAGVFGNTASDQLPTSLKSLKLSSKHTSSQANKRSAISHITKELHSETSFVNDVNTQPTVAEPKTSSLLTLAIQVEKADRLSTIDDLDEVIPSPYFLQDVSIPSTTWHSIDSGVEHSHSMNDSDGQRTGFCKNKKESSRVNLNSSGSISSGCCTDTSINTCIVNDNEEITVSPNTKTLSEVTELEKETFGTHSSSKVSAIEITEEERLLIDSLLKTGECLLDGEGELSSSGCFGESSSEHSSSSDKLSSKNSMRKPIVCNSEPEVKSIEETVVEQEEIVPDASEQINIDQYCVDSDVFSTTYQTISSSDFPHPECRLPSLTSSITRTWADAALSSSTSTCNTCTTCRESFERSCSDSMSWSSSQDTLDLLQSDADCMTWPPRKVNIVNLHDLPREKLPLDDRIAKWLGGVTLPSRHRQTPPPKPKGASSSSSVTPSRSEKLVYIHSQTNEHNLKSKQTKVHSPFNVTPSRGSKIAFNNRPLSRSYSMNFLMKLCSAASFRRKKVILFNHLREECQRHGDPLNHKFALC